MKAILKLLALFSFIALIGLTSCDKDDDTSDDPLTATEAKDEISKANDEIIGNFESMMATDGMQSTMFLMFDLNMAGIENTLKSSYHAINPKNILMLSTNPKKAEFMTPVRVKENGGFMEPGIYEYDFTLDDFVKVSEHPQDLITVYFPASQIAYNAEDNNAIADVTALELTTFSFYDDYEGVYYDEDVPTLIEMNIEIDGNLVFDLEYAGSFILSNDEQDLIPQSISVSASLIPYDISVSWTGSNRNYSALASIKLDSDIIASVDLDAELTEYLFDEAPELLSGHIQVTPLKAEGDMHFYNVEQAANQDPPDIDLMNENINVDLIQVELNSKLGSLAAKSFVDDQGESIDPILIFEDDSWETLEVLFEDLITYFEENFGSLFPTNEE